MTTDKIYDDAGVIRAVFYTWKPVVTHKMLQLVFEVPLEHQEKVLKVLGAPMPDTKKWVVIGLLENLTADKPPAEENENNVVPLKDPARSERFRNSSPADQAKALAHMWAEDPEFQRWCDHDGAAEALKHIHITCRVQSCKEFSRNKEALERFDRLIAVPWQQKIGLLAEARR